MLYCYTIPMEQQNNKRFQELVKKEGHSIKSAQFIYMLENLRSNKSFDQLLEEMRL